MTDAAWDEQHLQGIPLSEGVALGRVCRFNENRHQDLPSYQVEGAGLELERNRFRRAVALVSADLERLRQDVRRRVGPAEAEIFTAQRLIVEDEGLRHKVDRQLGERGLNVEAVVAGVLDAYEERLREVASASIRERATDIGEAKRRLLDALRGMRPVFQCADRTPCRRGRERIVVAHELTPALTVDLDTVHTLGFVTEHGGRQAHAAMLARALGIPAVSGIPGIQDMMPCGTELLVDGTKGVVLLRPSPKSLEVYREKLDARWVRETEVPGPVDGLRVLANINRLRDIEEAERVRAEGVGLYRTEFEFMAAGRLLTEEDQYRLYAEAVHRMAGRPVTFRLLDAGGDKTLPALGLEPEHNPALGLRGARLLLRRPDVFKTQAAALARAAEHGPVRVLYPMVTGTDQFRRLRAVFDEAARGRGRAGLRHGVMFEVPAAVWEADPLLGEADFASVGTNDLLQYLLAVDRDNEQVNEDGRMDHPAFLGALRMLAAAARKRGKPLGVCGEMAGDPAWLPVLLDMGYVEISVSPRLIPGTRRAYTSAQQGK